MSSMTRADDLAETIEALWTHYADDLTGWEYNTFIPSVSEQLEARGTLSEKQAALLDQIFERVSKGGRSGGQSR